jgi:hypothetical protein
MVRELKALGWFSAPTPLERSAARAEQARERAVRR